MIDPAHLRNVLALASDHLRGKALPEQAPDVMAGVWGQIVVLEREMKALEEAAKSEADVRP